jgi:hypothetical protein
MAQDPRDVALIECLETARDQIIDFVLDPVNGVCGTPNVTVQAEQLNSINQLLAFLKVK